MKSKTKLVSVIMMMLIAGVAGAGDPDPNPYANGALGADGGLSLTRVAPGRIFLKIDFSGDGNGQVQIAPGEIECRKSDQMCAITFKKGTEIVLVAKAAGPNSSFSGWTGRCEIVEGSGPEACRVRLNEDTKVTANFFDSRFKIFSFNFPNLLGQNEPVAPLDER